MHFEKINIDTWPRKEYFEHYYSAVPCTYSMTVKLDITKIIDTHKKLYPTMIYYITTVVNRHCEFRTAFNKANKLGIYSDMNPCYTVFNKDTETFSNLWTKYTPDFKNFLIAYEKDIQTFGKKKGMNPKPDMPENNFPISMIPWTTFEGFNLNIEKGYDYLIPIFTMGKYYEENKKIMLPLSVQVHHAVCDGFHICRFINELSKLIND